MIMTNYVNITKVCQNIVVCVYLVSYVLDIQKLLFLLIPNFKEKNSLIENFGGDLEKPYFNFNYFSMR